MSEQGKNSQRPVFKIFVSSPSDVREERHVVDAVVSELREQYSPWVDIERILWENELLPTNRGNFQDLIHPVEETHLVIAILWSRIGHPLTEGKKEKVASKFWPPTWKNRNPTGTELEIVQALQAYDKAASADLDSAFPDLFVYRKTGLLPQISTTDAKAAVRQFEETSTFFDWLTLDERNGAFKAAFYQFKSLLDFEKQLTEHIPKWIEQRLGLGREQSKRQLTWPHGSPFRALEPFDVEHYSIFFGREKETFELLERFSAQEERGNVFLLVLGMSGSGKSSLMRAGVIARLMRRRDESWTYGILNPGAQGNLVELLLAAIRTKNALPDLSQNAALCDVVKSEPRTLSIAIEDYLERTEKKFFLLVDQLEELFSNAVSREEQLNFIAILLALGACKRVWIASTMRSDYYHRLEEFPKLFQAVKESGLFHLQSPGPSSIDAIVRKPALAAGLSYERDGNTNLHLDETIIDEANGLGDCLPLLEFTLHRLYEVGYEDFILSYEEYESIGRIGGAVNQHAQVVIANMDKEAQDALPSILDALIGLGADGKPVRHYPNRKIFSAETAADRMIRRLIRERLLVAGEDLDHHPTFALAHDLLLSHWNIVKQYVAEHRELLEKRQWLHNSAKQWEMENRNPLLLLSDIKLIDRAEILWVYADGALGDVEKDYVESSVKRRAHKGIFSWIGILCAFPLLCIWLVFLVSCILSPSGSEKILENESIVVTKVPTAHPYVFLFLTCPFAWSFIWLILNKINRKPSPSIVNSEIWVSTSILIVYTLGFFTPLWISYINTIDFYISWGLLLPFIFLWWSNCVYTYRKIRKWKRDRRRIKRLNILRFYTNNTNKYFVAILSNLSIFFFLLLFCVFQLDEIQSNRSQEILEELLNSSFTYNGDATISLVYDGADVDSQDELGYAPIHFAALLDDYNLIIKLIETHNADVNIENLSGETPLFCAIDSNSKADETNAFSTLIAYGADINHKNRDGLTPIHYAAGHGKASLVRSLVEQGGEINSLSLSGSCPSYVAASTGKLNVLSVLWGKEEGKIQQDFSTAASNQKSFSAEQCCCAAAWHRWRGSISEARGLYLKTLKKPKEEMCLSRSFLLYELAQTYISQRMTDPTGLELMEKALQNRPNKWMERLLRANLLWCYVQAGRFEEAKNQVQHTVPLLDKTLPSPISMNVAHAMLFSGDLDGAQDIYTRYLGQQFLDGRDWKMEIISDWTQLEWLGIGRDVLQEIKPQFDIQTMNISMLKSPEECVSKELIILRDSMIGNWVCDEIWQEKLYIINWKIKEDGKCSYKILQSNGDFYQKYSSTWRVGIVNDDIILGERGSDGAITTAKIKFTEEGHILLRLKETTSQISLFSERLYRRR